MEQITITLNNMNDVKREIDNCQRKAVTSVVELGYILRKADDAELFREAGYSSIFKFAAEEYGWSQSQTSRFMDINREFSEGGYSTALKEKYMGYGQAKLSEMLTLPDNIREELNPDMKREDIREVKREMKEAAEVEREVNFAAKVTLESTDDNFLTDSIEVLLGLKEFEKKIPALWPHIKNASGPGKIDTEEVAVSVSDTGFGFTRAGAYMYFFKKEDIRITRGQEKKTYGYDDFVRAAADLKNPSGMTLEAWYEEVFGRSLPKEESQKKKKEVAPAHKKEKKEHKKTAPNIETSICEEEKEELPGQTEIHEFAEKMPIKCENDEKTPYVDEIAPPEKEEKKEETEHEKTAPNIETSICQTNLAETGEREPGQQSGKCPYCSGIKTIESNDSSFVIRLRRNGMARIEKGIYHDIMEFDYCPKCGKELITDEAE